MATEVERLVVSLEASITKYERAMNRALGKTNDTARRIETRWASMDKRLAAGMATFQRGIALAFAGAATIRGATQLIDAGTRIQNSLKVAGLEGEELARVYDRLFASAQKNVAPLESLVTLYGRVAIVQKELGTSTEEMLRFTDNVALALRVAGTDAQTASGALLQLSQAMGSGVVRAEEFNSILEGALPIAQAAAAGLEEAGGSVAKLRALVVDGKVSSQAFFRAFEAGAYVLEEKVAGSELTVSQAFVRLQNVLIDVAAQFNKGTDASGLLAEGIDGLGQNAAEFATLLQTGLIPQVADLIGKLNEGILAAHDFANEVAKLSGLDRFGAGFATWINDRNIPGLSAGSSAGGRVLQQTFELVGKTPQDEALARALLGMPAGGSSDLGAGPSASELEAMIGGDRRTVSLADYDLPSGNKGSKKTPGQRYEDSVADFQRRLEMLNQETALLRGVNPLITDYGYAIEKLRAQQELENAATKAGIDLKPEQRKQIEALAESYANAHVEAEKLAESQEALKTIYAELGNIGEAAINGIVDALADGKIEANEFKDILGNVLNMAGQFLLNQAFSGLTGGTNVFSTLFGGGRALGGPVQAGKIYKVNENTPNSEYFMPGVNGMIVPKLSAPSSSGNVTVTFAPIINGSNLRPEDVTEQLRQFARLELPGLVRRATSDQYAVG